MVPEKNCRTTLLPLLCERELSIFPAAVALRMPVNHVVTLSMLVLILRDNFKIHCILFLS